MSRRRVDRLLMLAPMLAALCGCKLFEKDARPGTGKSPLAPLIADVQQTRVDVFFVRLPSGDDKSAAELWKEVDEQSLPAEQRKRLGRNGFRAGVIGTRLPPQVTEALARAAAPVSPGQVPAAEAPDQLGATKHQIFLRPGHQAELVASGVLSQFHVLEWKDGRPQGQTFEDGQGQFTITSEPLGDGRVRLELTPEVHYGPYQQRYAGGDGAFRFDHRRKKKLLPELKLQATLSPGETLLLAGRTDQPGSLGDRFFRESDGAAPRPRLLMLRISEAESDPAWESEKSEVRSQK